MRLLTGLIASILCVTGLHADEFGGSANVNILDPKVLSALEANGFSLSQMLGGTKNESKTSELYKTNAAYRDFANFIGQPLTHDKKTDQLPDLIPANWGDVPEMVRLFRNFEDKGKRSSKDLKGGYFITRLSNNSQYPYAIESDGDEPRHFDYRWLNSEFGYFKLVAIVNRIDRADFDSSSCGEVRFIYRLSYNSPKSSSSMPFFLNLVRVYPKKDKCAVYAKNWQVKPDIKSLSDFIKRGPLKELEFKQLEVNFQSLRFTSGYMLDFGGQAMYILRIFKFKEGKLAPITLENTPDVLEIEKNPVLLDKFVAYLKKLGNLEKLDQGTLVIDFDPVFLTKLAVSWSTLGRARTANKPYTRLFQSKNALLKSIDISKLKYIKSHDALVERLNNLTCMGCHQSSGTAGFQMLGLPDDKFSHGFNRQGLPFSPHSYAELMRRQHYVTALIENKEPNRFRPHSDFPVGRWEGANGIPVFEALKSGQMCILDAKHFANAPACEANLKCEKTVTTKSLNVLFGECVPKKALAGSACWSGEILENQTLPKDRGAVPAYNYFAFQDKWTLKGALPKAAGYKCVLPQSGAPLGRSTRPCKIGEENFADLKLGKEKAVETCANQGGNGFDLCAATGDSGACLEARVVRSMLDTCYPGKFCREDYICQKLPDYNKISEAHYGSKKNGKRVNLSSPKNINASFIEQAHASSFGFCVPTYFLFNMRVDGHPSPVTGLAPGEPKIDRSLPLRGYKK